MKKWKYENEIKNATTTLLNAYLATMHSETITIVFTYNDDVYAYDLTTNDLNDLARVNNNKLMTQSLTKKRLEKYLATAEKFATINDINEIKNAFPKYAKNNGYIAEFVYRYKKTNETIEQIKKSNKSIAYDKASDTTNNKQIKEISNGATFTTFEYLLKVAENKNLNNINEIKNAIETLTRIYSE
jgi:hypothetical protein